MTPLKSLRAWPLISVNFFNARIYCVPGPALSWTNPKPGYPAASSISDSPVEPSTLPTWSLGRSLEERSKSDPGPAPAQGNGSTRPRGLCTPCWQLEQCCTHAAPRVFKGPCTRKGQAPSPNILAAGGEHPSPKPSSGLHSAGLGCRGCWAPDTPFAVFGL